ncbi:MAG: hypothetical protein KG029_19200 [Bacteroidetes bacterium]|nr:hypothetical protein [Bacteroidota bacterium]
MDFGIKEVKVDDALNRPVDELTRKFFRDIMKSMEDTNKKAREILAEVQEHLVELTGIVNSPWMHEQRGEKGRDPRKITIEEMLPILRSGVIQMHIERARRMEGREEVEKLKEKLLLAESQRDEAIKDARRFQEIIAVQENTLSKQKDQLAKGNYAQPANDNIPVVVPEDRYEEYYDKVELDNDSEVLAFIVDKVISAGELRSPDLRRSIAGHLKQKDETGRGQTISDLLEHAETSLGLIYKQPRTKSDKGGRAVHIYNGTLFGEYYFKRKFGKTPIPPGFLREHKSTPHALMIMTARELLEEAGYVITDDHTIMLGASQFKPDITAKDAKGQTIYIEVENAAPKANQNQDAKWRNYRAASNGRMYVFFDNMAYRQEITRNATSAMIGYPDDELRLCYIPDARKHLKEKGNIWTHYKKGPSLD